jgi:transcriptional regulator with XRE-family HTH domain
MDYDQIALGKRLQYLRASRNLTQKAIGSILGIDQSTYSRMENGVYDAPLSILYKISKYYNVSVIWLLGENSIPDLTDSERLDVEKFIKYIISIRGK